MPTIQAIKPQAQKNTQIIKTVRDFNNWITNKDPMIQDIKTDLIKFKINQHDINPKKKRSVSLGKEFDTMLRSKINHVLELIKEINSITAPVKFTKFSFSSFLQKGLDEFMGRKEPSGSFVIKGHNNGEYATINAPVEDNWLRLVIKDSEGEPKRWYFITNNRLAKNYSPGKSFQVTRSVYANESEINEIKAPLNFDLDWITNRLEKSLEFINDNLNNVKI